MCLEHSGCDQLLAYTYLRIGISEISDQLKKQRNKTIRYVSDTVCNVNAVHYIYTTDYREASSKIKPISVYLIITMMKQGINILSL